jgi:hypothetical protein
VVLQESAPGLRRRLVAAHHVFAHAALGELLKLGIDIVFALDEFSITLPIVASDKTTHRAQLLQAN